MLFYPLWTFFHYSSSIVIKFEMLTRKECTQIQDLHASFGIKERRKHRGCSQSLHICSPAKLVDIELLFARAAVSNCKIRANFKNSDISAWNIDNGKIYRSCTYIFFLYPGIEIELIFALRSSVSKMLAGFFWGFFFVFFFFCCCFQNCHIWAWNLNTGKNSSRSCTCILFLPTGGQN